MSDIISDIISDITSKPTLDAEQGRVTAETLRVI